MIRLRHKMAVVTGQLITGVDVPGRPTHSHFREIHIGIAVVVHVLAHGGFVVEQAALFRLVEVNFQLLAHRGGQPLEFFLAERQVELRVIFPDFGTLGDVFPGEDAETVNVTFFQIGGHDNHGFPARNDSQKAGGYWADSAPGNGV